MIPEDAAALLLEHDPAVLVRHLIRRIVAFEQSLSNFERKSMTAIDDVATKVATLTATVAASNAKVDTLIGVCNTNFAALQSFINQGGLSPDQIAQLQGISDSIQGAIDSATAEDAKVDATVAADSPPPPAPAPAPAAQGDGTDQAAAS